MRRHSDATLRRSLLRSVYERHTFTQNVFHRGEKHRIPGNYKNITDSWYGH